MSSANLYPHCAVDVSASLILRILAAGVILPVVLAPWVMNLSWAPALLLSLSALPASVPVMRWARSELACIHWHSEGRWVLVDRAGSVHEAPHLLPGILVSAPILALHWRCECCGKRFRSALLYDNCERDARRRMQVRVRLSTDAELFTGAISSASG